MRTQLSQLFSKFTKLSEDWIATLIGLALVLIIGSGLFGPGPQSAKLSASAGDVESASVRAVDGWATSATLDGAAVPIHHATSSFTAGHSYVYICQDGQITVQEPDSAPSGIASDHAQIVLDNRCEAQVSLTMKTDYAIRWPAFKLFE